MRGIRTDGASTRTVAILEGQVAQSQREVRYAQKNLGQMLMRVVVMPLARHEADQHQNNQRKSEGDPKPAGLLASPQSQEGPRNDRTTHIGTHRGQRDQDELFRELQPDLR